MSDYPILSIMVWLPIIIGLILIVNKNISKFTATLTTILTTTLIFVFSIVLFNLYDYSSGELQFIERVKWIEGIDIFYFLAVDGISVTLIMLTAFINILIAIFASSEDYHNKSGYLYNYRSESKRKLGDNEGADEDHRKAEVGIK